MRKKWTRWRELVILLMRWKCKHITDWHLREKRAGLMEESLKVTLSLKNQENKNHLPVAKTHFHTFVDSYLNDSMKLIFRDVLDFIPLKVQGEAPWNMTALWRAGTKFTPRLTEVQGRATTRPAPEPETHHNANRGVHSKNCDAKMTSNFIQNAIMTVPKPGKF